MNILIIGSGGREHALAWKIKQSPLCNELFVAPGNPGTASLAQNIDISPLDFKALGQFCDDKNIDLVVVGPEQPLVAGIADYFAETESLQRIKLVGPNKAAAQLEGSKTFAKELMQRFSIPTARALAVTTENIHEGYTFLEELKPPYVIKADGLAAGKGVIITKSIEEAKETLQDMILSEKFGEAGKQVLIEEFLDGVELSVFILTDGKSYVLLPEAKDYKRIHENDEGPNTGGMGAVSPVPFISTSFLRKIEDDIVGPTLWAMQKDGLDYRGFVFFGLIKVGDKPYVIEYNARLGDPETQAILPRMEGDLVPYLVQAADGTLSNTDASYNTQSAVTTVLVADGYPGDYKKGSVIKGINKVADDILVFHAGTTTADSGSLKTNGGRVLAVTAISNKAKDAQKASQAAAEQITWSGRYYRKDIGNDVIK